MPIKTRPSRSTGARERAVGLTRARILQAAGAVLSQGGPLAFTIERIEARTGIARTTIYRHWPSRDALLEAVTRELISQFPQPDTGSLRQDLITFFAERIRLTDANEHNLLLETIPGMIEAARHNVELGNHFRVVVHNLLEILREMLERSRTRGEIRQDLDLPMAANAILGAIVVQRAFLETTGDYVAVAVDTVLEGCKPRM